MRIRFRIRLSEAGKKLTRKDLSFEDRPFSLALRYILEFKYLEATKWLMIAQDSREKYLLLGLIYIALGQDDLGSEFLERSSDYGKKTDLRIHIELPEEGRSFEIESPEDLKLWHTKGS